LLLRTDSNCHHQFQRLVCCHCTTQQFAVRIRIELILRDRQSHMLAITPTNRLKSVWDLNPHHLVESPKPLEEQTFCIADRIRTCNLSAPDGVSNQLECCYVLKVPPLHLTGNTLSLLINIFYRIKKAGCF
jgi:hypothetical protein